MGLREREWLFEDKGEMAGLWLAFFGDLDASARRTGSYVFKSVMRNENR